MERLLRLIAVATVTGTLIASTAVARTPPSDSRAQPNESDLTSHGHYINRDGQVVHSPAKARSGSVPAGASAKCADGTYSFSRHHSGTCSRHGGVVQWE